jgi:hypothetical protein
MTHTHQCFQTVVMETGSEYGLKNVDVGIGEPPTGNQVGPPTRLTNTHHHEQPMRCRIGLTRAKMEESWFNE